MKRIEFKVDVETGEISIYNDGYQIPVEQQEFDYTDHRTNETTTEVMYPAEIYFGDMFSGTNYDDMNEEEFVKEVSSSKKGRKTSGRNGMGAKAANIFSTEFTVDHTDTVNKKRFLQTYRDCGQTREKPVVTSYRNKTGYTRITFTPDYKYFKFPDKDKPRMTKNFYAYLRGYAYEMAMVTGLPVTFNEEKIVVKSLEKYARLFYPSTADNKMALITTPLEDEAVLVEGHAPDTESMDTVTHTSFINGIHTSRGGKYVNLFQDTIFSTLVRTFNSRKKKVEGKQLKTTAKKLYPYFHLFIRCEAVEPPFDSQTKDYCILEKFNFYTAKSQKEKAQWAKTLGLAIAKVLKWNFVSLLEEKLLSELDRANSKKESSTKGRLVMGK
jgi:DNA topoisomerase-2